MALPYDTCRHRAVRFCRAYGTWSRRIADTGSRRRYYATSNGKLAIDRMRSSSKTSATCCASRRYRASAQDGNDDHSGVSTSGLEAGEADGNRVIQDAIMERAPRIGGGSDPAPLRSRRSSARSSRRARVGEKTAAGRDALEDRRLYAKSGDGAVSGLHRDGAGHDSSSAWSRRMSSRCTADLDR